MHIPDAALPPIQSVIYLIVSVTVVLFSLRRIQRTLGDKHIPLLGLLGAGLLAAQMFNFPVFWGTSGHLIGTALATALVGPYGAILVIATVLLIQATFGDGGIMAYGANLLNMGVVAAFVSFIIIRYAQQAMGDMELRKSRPLAVGIAGFIATIASAFMTSLELVLAGWEPVSMVFGWMLLLHTVIGIAEAAISWAIIQYVVMVRADLLYLPSFGAPERGVVSVG